MIDILAVRINDAHWFKPIAPDSELSLGQVAPATGAQWLTESYIDDMDARWKLGLIDMYQWLADDREAGRRMAHGMARCSQSRWM